ncbi:ABC transporter permease [Kutzneria viridogrisea]|uniref:ABC transporter n=2 Tax=Kutzneria TaxID=43356 RepID=W5VYM4_9PSEU|nr:ABC transporter permease [Kutzneria albida]AHH93545.1 ABC transporter [Kutzneria albida DSM 43870]MBA8929070.1 ABC-2 type transport system permease protein [Kutzneria viridogrisea]
MHPSSTIDRPVEPIASSSRTWARAFGDIRDGLNARQLWAHLGWQDIKQRYRRSVLGPLWITIGMGVTALGIGLLYGLLFGNNPATFLPYVTVGFIVWNFVHGCLIEGLDTFIANEGLIKHLPAPLSVYVLRTVWRQTLMFLHNMVIYVIVAGVFFVSISHAYTLTDKITPGATVTVHPGLGWSMLLAIPGFLLIALNGAWVALLLGIISTRYRDIPQVINAIIQLLFYGTPIVWSLDTLGTHADTAALVLQFNPLFHLVEVLRAPLLGQQIVWQSWVVVLGMTVVGWVLAMFAMKNYRARVSYWV